MQARITAVLRVTESGGPLFFWQFKSRYKAIKEQHQINESIRDREIRLIGEDGAPYSVPVNAVAGMRFFEDPMEEE